MLLSESGLAMLEMSVCEGFGMGWFDLHTYKQIYIAPKSWKRIRGADLVEVNNGLDLWVPDTCLGSFLKLYASRLQSGAAHLYNLLAHLYNELDRSSCS